MNTSSSTKIYFLGSKKLPELLLLHGKCTKVLVKLIRLDLGKNSRLAANGSILFGTLARKLGTSANIQLMAILKLS